MHINFNLGEDPDTSVSAICISKTIIRAVWDRLKGKRKNENIRLKMNPSTMFDTIQFEIKMYIQNLMPTLEETFLDLPYPKDPEEEKDYLDISLHLLPVNVIFHAVLVAIKIIY